MVKNLILVLSSETYLIYIFRENPEPQNGETKNLNILATTDYFWNLPRKKAAEGFPLLYTFGTNDNNFK